MSDIDLSNIDLGMMGDVNQRPTLGNETSMVTFRLVRLLAMKFMESEQVEGKGGENTYWTGTMLGAMLYRGFIKSAESPEDFVEKASNLLKDLKIGLLNVEEAKPEEMYFRVRVDECVSCSGTPNTGEVKCHFEGGLIAGMLGEFLQKGVQANEIKCWGLGDKTCTFEVTAT